MSMAIEKYLDCMMIFANRNEGEARDVRVELEAKGMPRSGVWGYVEMACAAVASTAHSTPSSWVIS